MVVDFLNHYLAMLDKLNRNNIFFLLLFLATASCSVLQKQYYNTEILCPGRERILIKYARVDEVRAAIVKADYQKRKEQTSGNYTPIVLPNERSFMVNKIPPEEMINCSLYESKQGEIERNYIRFF